MTFDCDLDLDRGNLNFVSAIPSYFLVHFCEMRGMDFASTARSADNGTRWRQIIVKSSVVPQKLGKDSFLILKLHDCKIISPCIYYF